MRIQFAVRTGLKGVQLFRDRPSGKTLADASNTESVIYFVSSIVYGVYSNEYTIYLSTSDYN